jgi:tetratricopeptide (TPR) repeat protein
MGLFRERLPSLLPEQQELARQDLAGPPELAGRRTLLVLDNAQSPEQVIPLLLGAPGSLTVVTSSHRMPVLARDHGARVLMLGPLGEPDAEELLIEVAGLDNVRAAGDLARETLRLCEGKPGRICDVGATVQMEGPGAWQQLVREWAGEAGEEDAELARVQSAYGRLSPDVALLHRLLGRLPRIPLGAAAVAALTGCSEAEARRRLETLAELRLLEEPEEAGQDPGRLQQTPSAHRHAAVQPEPGEAGAVDSWLTWCLRTAAEAETSVMRGRWYLGPLARELAGKAPVYEHRKTALDVLRREWRVLVAGVRTAAERGLHAYVWQLCESMWALHLRIGFHEDCLTTHALGIESAKRCRNPRAEARMRVQRAFSLMALGRHDEAEAAFVEAGKTEPEEHSRGRATAIESLGLLRLRQKRHREAESCFRQALPLAERAGEPRAVALLRHHIGRALLGQEQYARALAQLTDALEEMRQLPVTDRYNQGRVLTSLGEARIAVGDARAAAEALDEALDIMTDEEGALVQEAAVTALRAGCEPDAARRRRLRQRARLAFEAVGDAAGAERMLRLLMADEADGDDGDDGDHQE